MSTNRVVLGVIATLVWGFTPSRAQAQHTGDILLSVVDARIDTGRIGGDGSLITGLRVFEAPFSAVSPGFTDTPGFDCTPGTFPVPSSIGFRLRKAIRKWEGGNFDTIPVEMVGVSFGPLGPVSTPSVDSVVTGFSLSVGSNGEWHRHLEYQLSAPGSDGVYLMEMSLFSSRAEIGESQPFWLVFGMNAAQADLDAAKTWVEQHLLCAADFNGVGGVTVQDIFDFLAAYFSGSPAADVNRSGAVTVQDIFDYLSSYFAGCA